jgi:hypothetical protein
LICLYWQGSNSAFAGPIHQFCPLAGFNESGASFLVLRQPSKALVFGLILGFVHNAVLLFWQEVHHAGTKAEV